MVCNDARAKAEQQALAYFKQIDDESLDAIIKVLKAAAERQMKQGQPAEQTPAELLKTEKK